LDREQPVQFGFNGDATGGCSLPVNFALMRLYCFVDPPGEIGLTSAHGSEGAHSIPSGDLLGERPQASFTVALEPLNGGGCYGPHFRAADGREELYCVLGVWRTDEQGLPQFTRDMLPIVVPLIGTMATHARGVSGQYHPPPAAQIRIPRAETRKKANAEGRSHARAFLISGFGLL